MISEELGHLAVELRAHIAHLQQHLSRQLSAGCDEKAALKLFQEGVETVIKVYEMGVRQTHTSNQQRNEDRWVSQTPVPTVMVSTMALEDRHSRHMSTA